VQDDRALVDPLAPLETDFPEMADPQSSATPGADTNFTDTSSTEHDDSSASDAVTGGLRTIEETLRGLEASVERFHERSAAHDDLVHRMQQRIDDLQRDQVRALLSPIYEELASLQADLAEVAGREWTGSDPDSLGKELTFLVTRVDSALHLLGLESVGAATGVEFDSRLHAAARRVPTGDPALDRTIERVYRQGFTFPGAKKVSMHARVTVYEFDPALGDDPGPDPKPAPPVEPPAAVAGGSRTR
jgi:molecular chaperone GrpE (heat shock protein)